MPTFVTIITTVVISSYNRTRTDIPRPSSEVQYRPTCSQYPNPYSPTTYSPLTTHHPIPNSQSLVYAAQPSPNFHQQLSPLARRSQKTYSHTPLSVACGHLTFCNI
ncbi:hypothetical protein K402DRAFT_389250 [Aulographum hederae CBS 113979]|uniref:Uncharacterized protein n=1 Tax=Aulographum hederae CBS 113979 TaxID=1176131 RepID=A0A6G1HCT8_9PEZI|nr:hypothetical protein K402DRAFT_389250 [Aulographum hederae CBS 113979]